jgi:hypothetical protein
MNIIIKVALPFNYIITISITTIILKICIIIVKGNRLTAAVNLTIKTPSTWLNCFYIKMRDSLLFCSFLFLINTQ